MLISLYRYRQIKDEAEGNVAFYIKALVSMMLISAFFVNLVKIRGKFTEKYNILHINLFYYINNSIFARGINIKRCNYHD